MCTHYFSVRFSHTPCLHTIYLCALTHTTYSHTISLCLSHTRIMCTHYFSVRFSHTPCSHTIYTHTPCLHTFYLCALTHIMFTHYLSVRPSKTMFTHHLYVYTPCVHHFNTIGPGCLCTRPSRHCTCVCLTAPFTPATCMYTRMSNPNRHSFQIMDSLPDAFR